jgi:putative pyruvate formate lyase activating enzyme
MVVANLISKKESAARNVNWVGGDPTSNLKFILEVLTSSETNLPQVWNSNMYLTEETMKILDGVIDVYLTDFKYGNDGCGQRLSKVERYWEITTRNHLLACEQAELIIRHLVLPNHVECCSKPILDWIAENLKNVRINVMAQYRPWHQASEYPEISKSLNPSEFLEARNYAYSLGLDLVE